MGHYSSTLKCGQRQYESDLRVQMLARGPHVADDACYRLLGMGFIEDGEEDDVGIGLYEFVYHSSSEVMGGGVWAESYVVVDLWVVLGAGEPGICM